MAAAKVDMCGAVAWVLGASLSSRRPEFRGSLGAYSVDR